VPKVRHEASLIQLLLERENLNHVLLDFGLSSELSQEPVGDTNLIKVARSYTLTTGDSVSSNDYHFAENCLWLRRLHGLLELGGEGAILYFVVVDLVERLG